MYWNSPKVVWQHKDCGKVAAPVELPASKGMVENLLEVKQQPVAAKRWDREAYNAYMREYMRKYRARVV